MSKIQGSGFAPQKLDCAAVLSLSVPLAQSHLSRGHDVPHHGTNQPPTIGGYVWSGCIRLVDDNVIDLYGLVDLGTKVVVLPVETHRNPEQMPASFASNHPRPGSPH
jgi:hypothetical protein